jgi:hypothetical protein
VTLTFVAGTYVAGGTPDIYTVSTLGVVAHPQGAGPTVPSKAASPVDGYYGAKATITLGGVNGVMRFTYSLDGTTAATSAEIVSTGGGTYAIPNTGIVLTFSGTQTAGDYWTFYTAGPTFTSTDLSDAITELTTTYLSTAQYAMVHVGGILDSAASWQAQTATLETAAGTLFDQGVYVRFINGCPTLGTVIPDVVDVIVDTADTDAVVIAARQGMSAPHVNPCAGDWSMASPLHGIRFRRNASWAAAARASDVPASQKIGAVEDGGVASAVALYRDENATQGFDAAGITSLRTLGGGSTVIYITDAYTATVSTSDYYPFTNARVIDRACTIVRAVCLKYINARIPTKTRNGLPGVITETKAQKIDTDVTAALRAGLVDGFPQDAVAARAITNRTNNVLATSQLIIDVAIQPFGYAKFVIVNIGMTLDASA